MGQSANGSDIDTPADQTVFPYGIQQVALMGTIAEDDVYGGLVETIWPDGHVTAVKVDYGDGNIPDVWGIYHTMQSGGALNIGAYVNTIEEDEVTYPETWDIHVYNIVGAPGGPGGGVVFQLP